MLGRMKEAVSDAAETLRRAFSGLAVVEVAPEPFVLRSRRSEAIGVKPRAGLAPPTTACQEMSLLRDVLESQAFKPFYAELHAESGWSCWGADAEVIRMTPLEAGQAARVAVPPLPRKVQVQGRVEAPVHPTPRRRAT